jgi:2-succinyl-5-enolpyruvyl-6-hydroxy-3-cyclohexene-1-carboxylate synthase
MHLSGSTPQVKEEAVCPSSEQERMPLPCQPSLAAANLNYAWAFAMVESFVRLGLRQAVLCPGSRNTPLLLAFAKHPKVEALSALDERSAAFFALGLAKGSGIPVALVCTSGTAVANLYPAIMEAFMSNVPLLVLTADRPSCARYCSTRQTVNQPDVFGRFTRFAAELSLPEAKIKAFAYLRQILLQAYEKALVPDPGPVHLNIPFEEPLDPKADASFSNFFEELERSGLFDAIAPPTLSKAAIADADLEAIFKTLLQEEKGLIVLGSLQEAKGCTSLSKSIKLLARLLNWPVLADVLSPLRYSSEKPDTLVTTYDCILANADLVQVLKPASVLQIGRLPNSKRLNDALESWRTPTAILHPYGANLDPLQRPSQHFRVDLQDFVQAFERHCQAQGKIEQGNSCLDSASIEPCTKPLDVELKKVAFKKQWQQAQQRAETLLRVALDAESSLFDGKVAYRLSQILPPQAQLVLANSRSVRNAEQFLFASNKGYKVYFNGGINGSDGITSTALGIAHRSELPTVLLTGDLAFLHDSNALLLQGAFQGQLTILLSNNAGGGIFHQLPVAQHKGIEDAFEKYIATPQQVCIRHMLAAYGLPYKELKAWEDLDSIDFTHSGIQLVEIKTNRTYDAAFHASLFSNISSSLLAGLENCERL